MKKVLLSLLTFLSLASLNQSLAQCTLALSNVSIQPISGPNPVTGNINQCSYTFNVSFDLSYNNGATYVYFTSYLAADYAALGANASTALEFECGNDKTPARDVPLANRLGTSLSEPGKSFLDIGLDLSSSDPNVTSVPVISTYTQDPTVALLTPANTPGLTVSKVLISGTTYRFTISNVTVILNQPCGSPIDVRTDVYASNANSSTAKAQCYICGTRQNFNKIDITGFKNCIGNSPRTFDVGIRETNGFPVAVNYQVYSDVDASGSITPQDVLVYDYLVAMGAGADSIRLNAANSYTFTGDDVAFTGNSTGLANNELIVRVLGNTLPNNIEERLAPTSCAPLPVSFKAISATRNKSKVDVKWTTSTESNNRGFNVQRNIGGVWENVAFVFSAATGGHSSSDLSYSFSDANATKGVTQYRIQQVDIDGKSKLSEIRSVKGETMASSMVVYPNPSETGKINVVFEDQSLKSVQVSDMSGRIVRSLKGVSNNVAIEGLETGVYSIQVTDLSSAAVSVEKVIIKKR